MTALTSTSRYLSKFTRLIMIFPSIRQKIQKKWQSFAIHNAHINDENLFPMQFPVPKVTDKQLLHNFTETTEQWSKLKQEVSKYPQLNLQWQQRNFKVMGTQKIPFAVEIPDLAALVSFVKESQRWKQFTDDVQRLRQHFPSLANWLGKAGKKVWQYQGKWQQLIKVCEYFINHPMPNQYIRELTIANVDTKFIEQNQAIIKELLDILLPESAINTQVSGLTNHGFARRFGLKYDQPLIRFRLLDPQLADEFCGLTDLSLPIEAFKKLDLLLDRVFITENKTNGLSFPNKKNSIVIFGLGYGIQQLKNIEWLTHCQIHYWGDIDSHGFAMLAQIKLYYPKTQSLLMDRQTLLHCKTFWQSENTPCTLSNDQLALLTQQEHKLCQQLAESFATKNLRLEQEIIPFDMLLDALKVLP